MKISVPGKIKARQMVAFANGRFTEALIQNTIQVLALPIYSIGLGVNPGLVGLAISLPRLWEAFTDPYIGYLSDNFRSKYGRRKPFMVVGVILAGLFYALLWSPPAGMGSTVVFLYFLIISLAFYTAAAVYLVPYYALGNELTSDPQLRAKLMTFCAVFISVAGLMTPWAYSLSFIPYFGVNEIEGVRVIGIIGGTLIIITGMLPCLMCKEQVTAQTQPKFHFMSALKNAFKTRPFVILCSVYILGLFGILLVSPLAFYVGTYYMFDGDKAAMSKLYGWLGSSWALTSILSSPFIYWLIKRFEKKAVLIASLVLVLIGQASQWWLFTPSNPYLSIISFVLSSPGIISLHIIIYSWLADVCDYDYLQSGLRREGLFSAVYGLVVKSAFALAIFCSGIIISIAGVNTGQDAIQSPEVILRLRLLFSIVPPVVIVIAIAVAIGYPLTKKRMAEIQQTLEQRESASV